MAKGALISPELTASIYYALGKASIADPQSAVDYGAELVTQVQQAVEAAYREGVTVGRTLLPPSTVSTNAHGNTVHGEGGAGATSESHHDLHRGGAGV